MSPHTEASFFERMYLERDDPWAFASSAYELERYARIAAAVGHRHYGRVFEPGCSIGVLTEQLAPLCDHLIGLDLSETAVTRARERCAHFGHVRLMVGGLSEHIPMGPFDLIVFSEIGYYFEEPELLRIGEALVDRLGSGGILLAAHWLGTSEDHVLSGDRVHEVLLALDGVKLEHSERHEGFRLDRWVRV